MKPGKNGQVTLENRLESWYVKTGARLLGDKALVRHVKTTPVGSAGEKVLSSVFNEDVKASLKRVSEIDHLATAALFFVHPEVAKHHLAEIEEPVRTKLYLKK